MEISRRDFLRYCGMTAGALGLSSLDLGLLSEALANPSAPSVIWLQGSSCTGCSVSFLNRISTTAPATAADVLVSSINLLYHPNLMAAAGDSAARVAQNAYQTGGYVLVVEGGVPTAYGGNPCWAWNWNGADVTFQQAVTQMASRAAKIISMGNCASFGGVAAAAPNPTGVKNVSAATGRSTINIAGCPPHPDWLVWAIVQILTNKTIALDGSGRPTALYTGTVHSRCPRRGTEEAETFGIDYRCLKELGCRGPETMGVCPTSKWNNGVNWCADANAPCIGCTSPTFPLVPVLGGDGGHDGGDD